jgi:hypothetical protein
MVALSPTGQVVRTQEVILSKGNFAETDTTQEGIAITYFDLTLGESGKEQSWRIPAVIEVAVSLLLFVFSSRLTFRSNSISSESRCAVQKVRKILYPHISTSRGSEWLLNHGVLAHWHTSYLSFVGSPTLRLEW